MSKTVKNTLLIFTLVCAIALVVFIIELIVINSNNRDAGERDASVSGSAPGGTEISAGNQSSSPTGDGSMAGPSENHQTQPSVQPTGKQYQMQVFRNVLLIIYADEELFEYTPMSSGELFTYTDGENASLSITPVHLPNGAYARAETILNVYLDGSASNVSGTGPIKRSSVEGVFVSGVNDGETFEAWIHELADNEDNFGVAFVIRYRNDEQKNALYDILDTLELLEV